MQRNTRQRAAILEAIRDSGRPLSVDELHGFARQKVAGLGVATVYRALRELQECGEVEVVELPGEALRYEMGGGDHHHHFHCRDCGRVFEVAGCPVGIDRLTPRGFSLERHEVLLYGLCGQCVRPMR